MRKISTVIIDKDADAKETLLGYMSENGIFDIANCFDSISEAQAYLLNNETDIAFVDSDDADENFIEEVKRISDSVRVIFYTSTPKYAVDSYDLNALDYIVKPVSRTRFSKTIDKILNYTCQSNERIQRYSKDYTLIKADHKLYKVEYKDIIFIEGQSEYVTFHLNGKQNITTYCSLKKLTDELPSEFFRIHKSYIVSLNYIDAVEGVMLSVAGRRLPIGKLYKDELANFLYGKPSANNNNSQDSETDK